LLFTLIIILYGILGALGLAFIKKGLIIDDITFEKLLNKNLIFGFLLYLSSFCIWIKILRMYDLNTAFPIASGTLFGFIIIISMYFLNETLSWQRLLGICLILLGIYITSKG